MDAAALATLDRTLRGARGRLRFRRIARALAIGLQLGLCLAVPVAIGLRLLAVERPLAGAVAGGVAGVVVLGAGLVGARRGGPDRRALAQLVDRLGGTDELVLTALHVAGAPDPNRASILARLRTADLPDVRTILPVRVPRHAARAVVPAILAVAAVAFVGPAGDPLGAVASPVVREGERIERRLDELRGGVELPAPLEGAVEALATEFAGDTLTPEEARARLAELQDRLAAAEADLAPASELLGDLARAADALAREPTEGLAEALRTGDLDAAADAASGLPRALDAADPVDRARAGRALRDAARSLQRSSSPDLRRVGESLERAGDAPGELARELARERELGEQLGRDRAQLERARELNGTLEGSRQRLGGSPQPVAGEREGQGDGDAGVGQGGGERTGAPGSAGHTWEEQAGGASASAADRVNDRRSGAHVDDFQRLYAELRLEGARAVLAGAEGALDPEGRVDEVPVRIVAGDEDATTPVVDLPAAYRDEAAEALDSEQVPAAYQQAVKRYFDDLAAP